jgi:hypothetical protein
MSVGTLGILNVGAGDTKLSFDKKKPAERERAAKIVTDMLRRGYAILIQVGTKAGKPLYQRAESFDAKTCEYIIVGTPPDVDQDIRTETQAQPELKHEPKAETRRGKKIGPPRVRIPAERTNAVAVARSAGG